MKEKESGIMFSPSVRQAQNEMGSAELINRLDTRDHLKNKLSSQQIQFIQHSDSFYFGTATLQGRPYIQHRGGPRGFIRIESASTLWFPDFGGNRQYITLGNLSENGQAFVFFMDYPNRRRLKLWGRARVLSKSTKSLEYLGLSEKYKVERIIEFDIEALDENCHQHIKQRFSEEAFDLELQKARQEIAELKKRIRILERL